MPPKTLFLLITLFGLMASRLCAAEDQPSSEQRVRNFVAACNDQKLDDMLALVTDDIQWLGIAGDRLSIETQGKPKLRESMAGHFKSGLRTRSELEWLRSTGSRVAVQERATWQGKSGPQSQVSLSVYEFRDGLICRVYYFPAEK